MAFIFYVLGTIVTVLGGAWCALVLAMPAADLPFVARLAAATPGMSVILGGLLLMAIGGVLSRLDKIVMSNADTADAIEDLLKHQKAQL